MSCALIIPLLILSLLDFFMLKNEWRVIRSFKETTCKVTNYSYEGYRTTRNLMLYNLVFKLQYVVDGKTYEGQTTGSINNYPTSFDFWVQQKIKQYRIGNQHTCWYNPQDPNTVVLERGVSISEAFLNLTIFLLIVCIFLFW